MTNAVDAGRREDIPPTALIDCCRSSHRTATFLFVNNRELHPESVYLVSAPRRGKNGAADFCVLVRGVFRNHDRFPSSLDIESNPESCRISKHTAPFEVR